MSLPRINLVVVGHKDHGKSTLIGRLLYDSDAIPEMRLQEIREELREAGKEFKFAYILDSLEEERTGGLTIDIMQTPFRSEKYYYTIIDCPGHREFIQKMLTGASQAEAAILVASVKEGIEDQTRQHLFLVSTLGIKSVIVAANKMDEVGYSEEEFIRFSGEMRRLLSSLGHREAPIVPVSALKGDNVVKPSEKMHWYRGEPLIKVLDETVAPPTPLSEKPLRCVVQDVYSLEGRSVVICRVETGTLRVGDRVVVLPSGEERTVKSIEAFGSEAEHVVPGSSVGVVLDRPAQLRRGSVLAYPSGELRPTSCFIAELIIFGDLSLRPNMTIPIRVGTATVNCRVREITEKIDPSALTVISRRPSSLLSGEVGKALFFPEEPIYVERYSEFPQLGRFVIIGENGAAAAGIILEKK